MTLERAIKVLWEYINEDDVYERYKSGENDFNDFEKFCIEHCEAIEVLLRELGDKDENKI